MRHHHPLGPSGPATLGAWEGDLGKHKVFCNTGWPPGKKPKWAGQRVTGATLSGPVLSEEVLISAGQDHCQGDKNCLLGG